MHLDPSSSLVILPAAFLLDLILGDPQWLPHPIRWMGKAISALEPHFRKIPLNPVSTGLLFGIFLIFGTWALTIGILLIAQSIHPLLKAVLEAVFVFYAISVRSLKTAAMEVYGALSQNDLSTAKMRVSRIIGRDVEPLNATGVAGGAVESVAENLVDGVISPMFYAAIGGAPLAMAFKMISTLDSMIGYKNEKYMRFGKAAARIDDIANYVPARLSIPLISFAARILLEKGRAVFRTAVREGANHASPNAGYPEAAFAGALGVRLNGPNYYGGRLVEKPFIGIQFQRPEGAHIKKACDLMLLTAFLWLGVLCGFIKIFAFFALR